MNCKYTNIFNIKAQCSFFETFILALPKTPS